MERWGFIRTKLDVKILILYILSRLSVPIDAESLAELVLIDGGLDYFEYKQCLAELTDSAMAEVFAGGYVITAKGMRNAEILSTELAFPLRQRASEAASRYTLELKRSANILANHENTPEGTKVYLALSDGIGNIFDLKILAAGPAQAMQIERNFKKKAESFYLDFIQQLTEEGEAQQ